MILVSTGTNGSAFDRLLMAVAALDIKQDLVVQHGPSKIRPVGARCVAYMSFDEYSDHVRQADVVVTHAGAGSVLVSLIHGKSPVVVPRLARFREAVDDHQLVFARRLACAGFVRSVEDLSRLDEFLGDSQPRLASARVEPRGRSRLVEELGDFLTRAARARTS